jgi:hypothetical protein
MLNILFEWVGHTARYQAAAVSPFWVAKAPSTTAVRDMGDINKPHS